MKLLLLAMPLVLVACVKPECVVYVNGKPVYDQCYPINDSDDNDGPAISVPAPDDNDHPDDDHGDDNGNGSHSHDDSNGDNSD